MADKARAKVQCGKCGNVAEWSGFIVYKPGTGIDLMCDECASKIDKRLVKGLPRHDEDGRDLER